ncbi:MAG: hypothetical protein IJW82_05910 [Clostridia bacterium]|nr:hypothetical protein [Clostridia bacterium]
MRLKNLKPLYVYSPEKKKVSGEYETTWFYKGEEWLNPQQDLDELNRNSAGEIDYEIIKLRIDRDVNINKGDGISFDKLEVDETKKVINGKPSYIVENKPRIGNTTLYTLITNNGE